MDAHPSLFDAPMPPPAPSKAELARERFEGFDRENPRIYQMFRRFALQAIASGCRRIGGRLIAERIRWEMLIATTGDDDYKLNDHYTPFYVRKFVAEFPEHADVFERRPALADAA